MDCQPAELHDSITVNHNIKTKMHVDGINIGPSLCFAVGDYQGGELVIQEKDGIVVRDVHARVLLYDGQTEHAVAKCVPEVGERISFIVYRRAALEEGQSLPSYSDRDGDVVTSVPEAIRKFLQNREHEDNSNLQATIACVAQAMAHAPLRGHGT